MTFVFLLLQGPGEGDKSLNKGESTVFIQRACRLTESLLDNREWIKGVLWITESLVDNRKYARQRRVWWITESMLDNAESAGITKSFIESRESFFCKITERLLDNGEFSGW